MNKSDPNKARLNVGDTVTLSDSVVMPGILQLSFGSRYEVVNVGRANNPDNDHIYVKNDHGRVVPYLARIFELSNNSYQVLTEYGIFKGAVMEYVNPYGDKIVIMALPELKVSTATDQLAGIVMEDETGFHAVGKTEFHFNRNFFHEIR